MKEATGELNMTVVTVVAIAAVAAFFYAFVWPQVKNSISQGTKFARAVCPSTCKAGDTCPDCKYQDEDGNTQTVTCQIRNN